LSHVRRREAGTSYPFGMIISGTGAGVRVFARVIAVPTWDEGRM
jgi:hypothetical protein